MAFSLIALDSFFACSLLVLVSTWLRLQTTKARRGLPLPPGPPGWPIVGNLFDMPRSNEWLAYHRWGVKYGSELVCLSAIGVNTVIVNSARAAHELFVKRSATYSERPALTAIKYLGIDTWDLAFLGYTTEWRLQRKLFHEHFKPSFLAKYGPHQEKIVHDFLRTLIADPTCTEDMQRFKASIRHATGRIIMHIAYGTDIQDQDDPYLLMLEKAVLSINAAIGFSGIILDLVPFLQKMPSWFPGAGFKNYAARMRPEVGEVVMDKPWDEFTANIDVGDKDSKKASVAGQLLEKHGADPALLSTIKAIPGVMYVAGADTTVCALTWFFLAMILHPDAQRKAQEELESILSGALPTLADRDRLPYTNAVVKEVFRWHPVGPLGLAHATSSDDVYEGMFIPAGSIVIGNVWAILHDPTLFPDPEAFEPSHFISTENGGTYPIDLCTAGEPPFPEVAFGFGRRICPGKVLAMNSVWLIAASVLSMFNIGPAKDVDGEDVPVAETCLSGVVSFPGPYRCAITPRSRKAWETIMATATASSDK
ncbi:cytochrome P450 [Peniophora sp. CONT]|nr:cytochrome P450 [Peniophora sp. CONT]